MRAAFLALLVCGAGAGRLEGVAAGAAPRPAREPATVRERFEVAEPLGTDWPGEWLTRDFEIDLGERELDAASLRVEREGGASVPAQCSAIGGRAQGERAAGRHTGEVKLRALFRADIRRGERAAFVVTNEGAAADGRRWRPVTVVRDGARTLVSNGIYEVELDASRPLLLNAIRAGGAEGSLGEFRWPDGVEPEGVRDEWVETGPARAIVVRRFRFRGPAQRYELALDFRAEDPWIDVRDDYALGPGTAVTLDLSALEADFVFHPHTYNARTFRPDGREEDSTLQPPQHPIATLGPVWRDIWFGGGPFAFVYGSKGAAGVGIACVRGSEWDSPEDVTLESQNIFMEGDRELPGRVRARIPTDAGKRRWALVMGPPETRKAMGRLVRSRADRPLDMVLREWVLEWESAAPPASAGMAGVYAGTYFNQHSFNPTTFPRRVRREIPKKGPVRSRDLAVLAYVFSDPDYWPGPRYRWHIGNPNFNTDMYRIPLTIGLLMPDHPHAKRWVDNGVAELKLNIDTASFPGGAWAESLSYSGFFFHVAELARMVRDSGGLDAFREWPRLREVATYLGCMHTPPDPRYGSRQKAPIGDTSPGSYIDELRRLGECYRGADDAFAAALSRFPERWEGALDISSREFPGFGAMLRGSPYDERRESFVTVKAGPARNHFQGDEMSFYFASLGAPLAIDYACHYSPRPWSAAIHNRPDMDDLRPAAVAVPRAFRASPVADVFVADERTRRVNHVPIEPHEATKPGWEYPWSELPEGSPWTMRRWVMLVKHDPKRSRIADYLVVRDEVSSPRRVWWNLHVLGRRIERDGGVFRFPGQLDVDLAAHFVSPRIGEVQEREWGWRDAKSASRRDTKGEAYERAFFGAWIPKGFERGTWGKEEGTGGEMAKWLRVGGAAGQTEWLVVLMPNVKGEPPPKVERLSATSARVTLDDESEVVHLGAAGRLQAAVERAGVVTRLLGEGEVGPWDELGFGVPPKGIDRGGD